MKGNETNEKLHASYAYRSKVKRSRRDPDALAPSTGA
jgi:hypothetical protein